MPKQSSNIFRFSFKKSDTLTSKNQYFSESLEQISSSTESKFKTRTHIFRMSNNKIKANHSRLYRFNVILGAFIIIRANSYKPSKTISRLFICASSLICKMHNSMLLSWLISETFTVDKSGTKIHTSTIRKLLRYCKISISKRLKSMWWFWGILPIWNSCRAIIRRLWLIFSGPKQLWTKFRLPRLST